MAASLFTMPIIVLNMGGEMVYILNQRLQAQSVQEEKAKKVLQDVLKAMFSALFIQELFKPQEMYSSMSTKQIFEKLAHSSIMRLNKSSMDKLYDLMTMGFKRQILTCTSPHQFLVVTLNHLESLKLLVNDAQVHELIQTAIDSSISTYGNQTNGQLMALKHSLMRFLQDKKVKVSLFLQQGLQTPDGVLVLPIDSGLPYGTEIPGTVRYFENGCLVSTSRIKVGSHSGHASNSKVDLECKLGLNMYIKDAAASSSSSSSSSAAPSVSTPRAGAKDSGSTVNRDALSSAARAVLQSPEPAQSKKSMANSGGSAKSSRGVGSSAKAELTMLADLLGMDHGGGAKGEPKERRGFRINLFPGDSKDDKDGGGVIHFDIDASADAKSMSRYLEELDLNDDNDAKAGSKNVDDDDDLLSLMDSAK